MSYDTDNYPVWSLTFFTYPYLLTERGEAMIFNYQFSKDPENNLENKENTATGLTIKLSDKK